MTISKRRRPRSPTVIKALRLVRAWIAEGQPIYRRGRNCKGLFAEAAREVGISPQQVQEAWHKYKDLPNECLHTQNKQSEQEQS